MLSVFVCVRIPPIKFLMPESIFMKLGMYIMAPEAIWTAYFINPSHHSLCLYVYPPIVARQVSIKTLPRQRLHMQEYKIYWTHLFLCDPCRIKRMYAIGSSRNFFYLYYTNNRRINLISLTFFDFHISLFKNQTPCQIVSVIFEIRYIRVRCNEGLLYLSSIHKFTEVC
jgi:hypothetical protein